MSSHRFYSDRGSEWTGRIEHGNALDKRPNKDDPYPEMDSDEEPKTSLHDEPDGSSLVIDGPGDTMGLSDKQHALLRKLQVSASAVLGPPWDCEYIALVGACYIDTILDTPFFPAEDSKLRATGVQRRRGGNVGNIAEVLGQFALTTKTFGLPNIRGETPMNYKPLLLSVFPSWSGADGTFIRKSFEDDSLEVELGCSIEREDVDQAPASYIIRSAASGSRTIVNYTGLEEMSFDEFKVIWDSVCEQVSWWHFEGRNIETTQKCIMHIRKHPLRPKVISFEVEKPGREGLMELALMADVVFFSRSWAQNAGYDSPERFLQEQASHFRGQSESRVRYVFCTWGEKGAGVCHASVGSSPGEVYFGKVKADGQAVDTIGAGDTFVAVIIAEMQATVFTEIYGNKALLSSALRSAVDKAIDVCSRKVYQEGFGNLAPFSWRTSQNQ